MPAFYNSRVLTISDRSAMRMAQSSIAKTERLNRRSAPKGLVNSFNGFSYSLNECYQFEVDAFGTLGFGTMATTFEQCRACLEACEWIQMESSKWDFAKAKKALRTARKESLSGDALMFHFVKEFRTW